MCTIWAWLFSAFLIGQRLGSMGFSLSGIFMVVKIRRLFISSKEFGFCIAYSVREIP